MKPVVVKAAHVYTADADASERTKVTRYLSRTRIQQGPVH